MQKISRTKVNQSKHELLHGIRFRACVYVSVVTRLGVSVLLANRVFPDSYTTLHPSGICRNLEGLDSRDHRLRHDLLLTMKTLQKTSKSK